MVMAVLKVYFEKKGPSVIQYDYKNVSNDKFRNVVNELIKSKIETSRLDIFVNTVLKLYSKSALVKNVILKQMKILSWTKFWKRQLWKDHNLKRLSEKTKKKLGGQVAYNKGTIVPASCGKKNKTILKILTLENFWQ